MVDLNQVYLTILKDLPSFYFVSQAKSEFVVKVMVLTMVKSKASLILEAITELAEASKVKLLRLKVEKQQQEY